MITVRKAREEDIIAVTELERQCFSRPWSYQSFVFELQSGDSWFSVALMDGEIIGFAVLHRFVDEGELFNIAVSEKMRGRGVGDRLLCDIIEGAKKHELKKIFLEVRKTNEPAKSLYKKHGFEVCGLRRNYYDDPKEDAIIMEKRVFEDRKEENP